VKLSASIGARDDLLSIVRQISMRASTQLGICPIKVKSDNDLLSVIMVFESKHIGPVSATQV
jgi:hypothetical protein